MLGGNLHFAFIAGVFAALGSVFGKLSGSTDQLERFINIFRAIPTDKVVRKICDISAVPSLSIF